MHPDLQLIVHLWTHDERIDKARARAGELKSEVLHLTEAIEVATQRMEGLAASLSEAVKKEGEINAELSRYIDRRDRAARLLEGGEALDFVSVQKQFEQCSEHVERLENDVLESMEQREQLVEDGAESEAERERLRDEKGRAHENWVSEGRKIRTEIEEVWPHRQAAYAELNRELASKYDGFRSRNMVPIAAVGEEVCTLCHVVVQGQMRIEVNNGRRLHCCRGCGRWLLPQLSEE